MTDPQVTTDVFWSVDGVSLQSYAFNISSWGGTRQSPAPLRGDDIKVPYIDGALWVPKVIDSQTITLGMWVIGANEDGSVPADRRAEFERNWLKLKRLLWNPYRQVRLTKRWYEGDELMVATGLAEFAGGLEPEMTGEQRAAFTVDLHLADPFFYSEDPKVGYRWTTARNRQHITGLGDVKTRQIQMRLYGPLNSPVLLSEGGEGLAYVGFIPAGQVVRVNVPTWRAEIDVPYTPGVVVGDTAISPPIPAHTDRVPGRILYTGARHWFQLQPFEDTVQLTAYSGSDGGRVEMDIIPSWI